MWPGPGCVIGGSSSAATGYGTVSQDPSVPTQTFAKGIWRPSDAAHYLAQSFRGLEWPTLPDPNFANVVVCWHGNRKGSGQGNLRMLPPSRSPADCDGAEIVNQTVAGLMMQTPRLWGLHSFLTQTGCHVVHNVNNGITLGAGDWTIEGWCYPTQNLSGAALWDFRPGGGGTVQPMILLSNTAPNQGKLTYFRNGDLINDAANITTNTWHHFAACRDTGTVYLYKDGVSVGSVADATNMTNTGSIHIGTNFNATLPWAGYLQEYRCTPGVARYPGGTTFTVPTIPFPDY